MKMESNEGWIVCRVCLNNQSDSEDLLQDIFSQNANTRLDQMLHICAGIPISADDNFPDKMCSKCVRCLRLAFKFRQTCQRSHQHISDMLARGGNNTRSGGEECASSGEDYTAENVASMWEENTNQLDMCNVKLEDEDEEEQLQEETVSFIVTPHVDDTGGDGEGLEAIVYEATAEDETEASVVYEDTQTVIEVAETYTEYEEYELLPNESPPRHSIEEPAGAHSHCDYPVEPPDDDMALDVLSSDEASDMLDAKPLIRSRPPRGKRTGKLGIIALDGPHFDKKLGRKPRDKLSTYICDVCGNTYPTQARLTEHMKFHSGVKPHECEICGRGFVQNQQLVRHMNTHTGNRPYKCNYCPAAFADRSTKTKHHRIHTKERPYECDVCARTFTYSDNLKFHKMIHTGEKPHVCDLCGKGFVKAYKMRLHRVTHEKRPLKTLKEHIEGLGIIS